MSQSGYGDKADGRTNRDDGNDSGTGKDSDDDVEGDKTMTMEMTTGKAARLRCEYQLRAPDDQWRCR